MAHSFVDTLGGLRVTPSLTEDVETALLRRCAAGELDAADTFVRRYQPDVVRFLSRMLGAHDEALLDVAQSTFVAAIAAAPRFVGRSRVRTWLLGIAHNKARMEIRSRVRRRRALDLLARVGLVAPSHQVPPIDGGSVARRLEAAIQQLDPDRRAVFVLCEVEDRTCHEVAETLGVPEGTVRRWLAEAKHRLRPSLVDLVDPTDKGGPS